MPQELLQQQLDLFFQQYKPLRYKKRATILQANDSPSSVFYVKSGYIRVFRISEKGEELTLTILKPLDFFPLTYGISTKTNIYYLEAITPLELWRVPQDHFLEFIKTNPEIYQELTARILIKFDGTLSRMEYLVFSNAYIKIASTILICARRFGEKHGEGTIIPIPLTHKDIATLVGITRETTSLEMKKLEKKGYIGKAGRFIVIKNEGKLEQEILQSNDLDSPFFNSI